MKTRGKIVGLDLDFVSHKPKLTIQLANQELIGYEEIKDSDELEITIQKPTKERSLNANRYLWVLIQKIADVSGTTKEEVYKKYIQEKGIFRTVTISNEAVNTFIHLWEEKGLGYICEPINKGNTMTDLIAYYGSSSYNSKQMSTMIDYIVEDAKELGIETMTPNEILELIEKWGNGIR